MKPLFKQIVAVIILVLIASVFLVIGRSKSSIPVGTESNNGELYSNEATEFKDPVTGEKYNKIVFDQQGNKILNPKVKIEPDGITLSRVWATYKNTDFGYSFDYPINLIDKREEVTTLVVDNNPIRSQDISVGIKSVNGTGFGVSVRVNAPGYQTCNYGDRTFVIDVPEHKIGDATFVGCENLAGGHVMVTEQSTIERNIKNGNSYVIYLTYPRFFRAEAYKIAESFKFTDIKSINVANPYNIVPSDKWSIYKNTDFGYSFEYPSNLPNISESVGYGSSQSVGIWMDGTQKAKALSISVIVNQETGEGPMCDGEDVILDHKIGIITFSGCKGMYNGKVYASEVGYIGDRATGNKNGYTVWLHYESSFHAEAYKIAESFKLYD